MQLIAVDVGNSATKVAFGFPGALAIPVDAAADLNSVRWFGGLSNESAQHSLQQLLSKLPTGECCWFFSSVHAGRQKELAQWVDRQRPQDRVHMLSAADIPIKTDVECREHVGRDRLLAALAAWKIYATQQRASPAIVIDAGTAVTVDLVDESGCFAGGNILLGADAVFEQISGRTDALPQLDYAQRWKHLNAPRRSTMPFGKSTVEAILSGVYQSQLGGLLHLVKEIERCCDRSPVVVITGGGWEELSQALLNLGLENAAMKSTDHWITDSHLVLKGVELAGSWLAAARNPEIKAGPQDD